MANHMLAIGINYSGSQNALRGCVNDANDWANFFRPVLSATPAMLIEQEATKANILAELSKVLAKLAAGDTAIVTYSGHGTYIPDRDNDETDRRDEALCPWDMQRNLLLDDELRDALSKRAQGSRVLLITDCCHSGTMTRDLDFAERLFEVDGKPRFVDFYSLSTQMCLTALDRIHAQARAARASRDVIDQAGLTHWAGCKDTELSYDANIGGKFCGAFTDSAIRILNKAAKGFNTARLSVAMEKLLPSTRYPQTPQFSGDLSAVIPGFDLAEVAPVVVPATVETFEAVTSAGRKIRGTIG